VKGKTGMSKQLTAQVQARADFLERDLRAKLDDLPGQLAIYYFVAFTLLILANEFLFKGAVGMTNLTLVGAGLGLGLFGYYKFAEYYKMAQIRQTLRKEFPQFFEGQK
jgi:hypothetical protein